MAVGSGTRYWDMDSDSDYTQSPMCRVFCLVYKARQKSKMIRPPSPSQSLPSPLPLAQLKNKGWLATGPPRSISAREVPRSVGVHLGSTTTASSWLSGYHLAHRVIVSLIFSFLRSDTLHISLYLADYHHSLRPRCPSSLLHTYAHTRAHTPSLSLSLFLSLSCARVSYIHD